MQEPIWIEAQDVLLAHAMQIAEHGGGEGVRDLGLLESALGKPRNLFAYEKDVTLERLAASYAFGIARNHPFVDGNKRTALVISEGFLLLNGRTLEAPQEEIYLTYLYLAAGKLDEAELTAWLTEHTRSVE